MGQEVDDLMIRRFLRARDMDIEKASVLFLKYLAWRKTVLPKGHIPESEIANDLSHNKVCMQGHDKKGRPILVIVGNRHNPSKGNPEEFKRESPTDPHHFPPFLSPNLSSYASSCANLTLLKKNLLQCFWAGFVVYALEKICARLISIYKLSNFFKK